MKRIGGILLLMSLVACATTTWQHPTKTQAEFPADEYDCIKVAEQTACNWNQCGNIFTIAMEQIKCLNYKHGWYAVQK